MSSSSTEKYDVFLSFRGDDTRKGFTKFLFEALVKETIDTYMDTLLERGEKVWPALSDAIDNSRISIVVFSENYGASRWCLEELVRILQRRRDQGQVVIPVFYETDPSDIRKQTGSFGKAIAIYEGDVGHKDSWKAALTEAANISGWDARTYGDYVQLIKNVVDDVWQKLSLRHPIEQKGLVGTEELCREVESYMNNKIRVLGIWGMPGIGKTTIARVLFAKLSPQFDNVCFVDNVKKYSLDRLLSELLKKDVTGTTFDMRRLSSKKVFIVLDNVNSSNQLLEDLCRKFREQNQDSRLIITTRNKQLLEGIVDFIYKVEKWKNPESRKFFCSEAFNESDPPYNYEVLTESVVKYADGNPLALKVLGSHLRSKTIKFWESTLRKLDNKHPTEAIQSLLKEIYDGLDYLQKEIFLDIAYFFNGENKDRVISILDACGFEASSGIEVLEDKALITISYSNIIEMHNLLQIMAIDIVREKCSRDPTICSRLREFGEVSAVLKDNKGTDAIEGISVDLSKIEDLHLSANTFTKMNNLRLLKVYISLGQSYGIVHLPEDLESFSNKLRYLEWNGYPLESLPLTFCAKLLVEIRMPHSLVKQLWKGKQELGNLEAINLSKSKQLKELPDLSEASRLKWVDLSGCESLEVLHPSFFSDALVTLILDGCTNLLSVKSERHLKYLQNISLDGCSSLKEFDVSSDSIERLDLSNTAIETLDKSIGLSRNLRGLNLEGLGLKNLRKEFSSLTSLTELKLSYNGQVIDKDQLHVIFDGLRSLERLYLTSCSNLFELPENIGALLKLYELNLDGNSVKRLPTSIKHLQELEILSLRNCRELLSIPELPPLVKELYVHNCNSLVSVSNLNTFARKMVGKTKRISFKNNLKLDGQYIMRSLHLTMVSAAFHNVLVTRYAAIVHSYNYNSVEVCLPGNSVPRQFTHETNKSSDITIQLSMPYNLLGIIYYVVLSPSHGIEKHGAKIQCECTLAEGTKATWKDKEIGELNSDHVYIWYDPFHCEIIRKSAYAPEASFEFSVINDMEEVDVSISIKECGVYLITHSDLNSVLHELELDSDNRKDLAKEFGLHLDHNIAMTSKQLHLHASKDHSQVRMLPPPPPRSYEKESDSMRNQTPNQLRDLSEQSSYDWKAGATSSKDTPEEDDTTTLKQMIVSCTTSASDEPTSHLPTILPFAEGSNRGPEEGAPNRSSKQEGSSETSHVGGSELPFEVSRSQRGDVILKVGLDHLEPPMANMERVREPHEDMADHGGGHSLEGSNNEASVSNQMHLGKLGSIKQSVVAHADKRLPNNNDVDRGPFIPPQVQPNVEEELRFLDLSADCVAVLGPFLTSHPTMRLNKPHLFCRSAYECLWRFLLFVGSHPLSALLGDRRGDFTDFMDALTHFSFDPAWLDNLRVRLILPSDDSPSRALERILLRKQQISAEMENLRLEMESLEQQESRLRSLLDAPLLRL